MSRRSQRSLKLTGEIARRARRVKFRVSQFDARRCKRVAARMIRGAAFAVCGRMIERSSHDVWGTIVALTETP